MATSLGRHLKRLTTIEGKHGRWLTPFSNLVEGLSKTYSIIDTISMIHPMAPSVKG